MAGTWLWVEAKLTVPSVRVNSFQFNYRKYLVHKRVYHQLFFEEYRWVLIG
ncbi:MAG: DUF4131 domain-containing protein [Flavobacteriales bacterium AspAUS03]